MRILIERPPNFNEIIKVFPSVEYATGVIFCYGDAIYNPNGIYLSEASITHERVHSIQQGIHPKEWWDEYLINPEFRLQQEIEAYGTEYSVDPYNIDHYARVLSGPTYGNIISFEEAKRKIIDYAKEL